MCMLGGSLPNPQACLQICALHYMLFAWSIRDLPEFEEFESCFEIVEKTTGIWQKLGVDKIDKIVDV